MYTLWSISMRTVSRHRCRLSKVESCAGPTIYPHPYPQSCVWRLSAVHSWVVGDLPHLSELAKCLPVGIGATTNAPVRTRCESLIANPFVNGVCSNVSVRFSLTLIRVMHILWLALQLFKGKGKVHLCSIIRRICCRSGTLRHRQGRRSA